VWYLENPRYCLLQRVDGIWLQSLSGTQLLEDPEKDCWSAQDGMESITILVGPISEKATAVKVGIPFTTDRLAPKPHWVFSPDVKIAKKGEDYSPEVKERAKQEQQALPLP
jgi:hypothetical protein